MQGAVGKNKEMMMQGKSGMMDIKVDRVRWWNGWLAAVLLGVLYWVVSVGAMAGKTTTFDEIAHLPSGYIYWTHHQYQFNPENGNLPQRWAGLGLVGGGWKMPADDTAEWKRGDVWTIGRQMFFELGNDFDAMMFRARGMMGLLGMGVVLVVYGWSRSVFGPTGGLVSGCLAVCCPTLLANGPLVTSDTCASLFFLLTFWVLWKLMHRISVWGVLGAGVLLGGLCLAKMSAPLAGPVVLGMLVVRLVVGKKLEMKVGGWVRTWENRWAIAGMIGGCLVVVGVIGWVVLWGGYGFRFLGTPGPVDADGMSMQGWAWILEKPGMIPTSVKWLREWRALPEAYLWGFGHAMKMAGGRSAFLNGEYSVAGWRTFFPMTFLMKTPMEVWGMMVLAGLALVGRWRGKKAREVEGGQGEVGTASTWSASGEWGVGGVVYALLPIGIFFVVYWVAAIASHLNIGHRHILPTYPVIYIACGAAGWWLLHKKKVLRVGVAAVLFVGAAEMAGMWPNYMAYFNALAGGPGRGHEHLVDSSLDWGQELPALKKWLEEEKLGEGSATEVYLSYFGTGSVKYYGIKATLLPGFFDQSEPFSIPELNGGVYCVSATMLQGVYVPYFPGAKWTVRYEQRYRQAAELVEMLRQTSDKPEERKKLVEAKGDAFWVQAINAYRGARLGRLCAYLRTREPEEQIGYSIHVYRLTGQEVEEAVGIRPYPPAFMVEEENKEERQ